MATDRPRLNVLLVEDSPRRLNLVRDALEQANARCRLHGVGAGSEVLQYLRRQAHYADAPRPDLVLIDFSQPSVADFELLKELKSSEEFLRMPLVLLTRPESEHQLEEQFESTGTCAVFSPIELSEFLRTMTSRQTDQFVEAVSVIAELGIVLVRAPKEFGKRDDPRSWSDASLKDSVS